jgi:hypothetical protein
MKRIAINTGGGDAPGLNAVIRAVALSALNRGWEVLGIPRGYEGVVDDRPSLIKLDRAAVRGIVHLGGTILGTTNRGASIGCSLSAWGVLRCASSPNRSIAVWWPKWAARSDSCLSKKSLAASAASTCMAMRLRPVATSASASATKLKAPFRVGDHMRMRLA